MQRRTFLVWISRVWGVAVAALVAVPGMQYVVSTLRPAASQAGMRRRVARWNDLRPGEPTQFSIVGQRQDAWHVQPDEVLGRVWLVRRDASDAPNLQGVTAFTSICPHMGCQVQRSAGNQVGFVCPCHKASFGVDGQPEQRAGEKNHAPRRLDELQCELVQDDAGQWWVEVLYERFEHGLTRKVVKA